MEKLGIPGLTLMENAGRGVVECLEAELGNLRGRTVAIVCGPGNNGGDGFVCHRYLTELGARPVCILLSQVDRLKGDALTNAQRLLDSGVIVHEVSDPALLSSLLDGAEVVIDAIFGTGLSKPAQGVFADAIAQINQSGSYVVSVDVPSGVDADNGRLLEPAVRADLTVTMALHKCGHLLFPGAGCTGKLSIVDIGIPEEVLNRNAKTLLIDREYVRSVIPKRPKEGHKGTFGSCLLVCGSPRFSGAACLAGQATVRSGCGLVRLAVPSSIAGVVGSCVLDAVKLPMTETRDHTLSYEILPKLLEHAEVSNAVAIGPGLTTEPGTSRLVLSFLKKLERPVVIDADAINILAGHVDVLGELRSPAILTPHPGELSRLAGMKPDEINADRVEVPRELARKWNVVLVLKGAPTVVAEPSGKVYLNSTGNSGLGSGGTGDVLTGLMAGILAQGVKPVDAAIAAVFLHGLAADIAARELTEYCLCASDLIRFLPEAFKSVIKHPARKKTGS